MGEIIPFTPAAEPDPHWAGPCVCLGCRHEWVGVGPVGSHSSLACPKCELPKGMVKFPFGAAEGDSVLTCNHCGGEALTAYIRDNRHYVRCMGCGVDLTDEFYNG